MPVIVVSPIACLMTRGASAAGVAEAAGDAVLTLAGEAEPAGVVVLVEQALSKTAKQKNKVAAIESRGNRSMGNSPFFLY